ncbi:MAG TPA: TIGR01777 family oxidoreductase [Candidatus Binataceae bacterium]|nr:TIGR01777 family oxidoreductase [Candidatus Binataceae bacterium]
MRVFVTGATGFIGRALTLRLIGAGHQVTAWVRSERKARDLLGPDPAFADAACPSALKQALEGIDAVVNLAGEPAIGRRWTAQRKQRILDSRINLTRSIVDAIAACSSRPAVLISASAVGYYGDRGDEILEDGADGGADFLANLCRDWEAAALGARSSGVRVFITRVGVVLGPGGGALAKMIEPFRMGLGGPIGSGRQYIPWIHLHDLVELIRLALEDPRFNEALITTAPTPATARDFATALGEMLHRPSLLPVPSIALKLILGEASIALLGGQRVRPRRLEELGFRWRYETVESALANILRDNQPEIRRLGERSPGPVAVPDSTYLSRRHPSFLLVQKTRVEAPLEEVFHFFAQPQNLGVMTPAAMQFRIISTLPDEIRAGLRIEYSLQLGPIPLRWRTHIEEWQPPHLFVDSQESGPYRSWWHEHHFRADGNATVMEDRVYYAPPLGPLGMVANAVIVAPALGDIFTYRKQAMRLRFPG